MSSGTFKFAPGKTGSTIRKHPSNVINPKDYEPKKWGLKLDPPMISKQLLFDIHSL